MVYGRKLDWNMMTHDQSRKVKFWIGRVEIPKDKNNNQHYKSVKGRTQHFSRQSQMLNNSLYL